jgi:hypothetical protein
MKIGKRKMHTGRRKGKPKIGEGKGEKVLSLRWLERREEREERRGGRGEGRTSGFHLKTEKETGKKERKKERRKERDADSPRGKT